MYNYNLILNTHWDREYRWSFNETRFRLVEAVDDLIDIMERDAGFTYFHTDSQASMLDDYLEMRPENRARVEKLVREGRILTGPWYTLPAEFLVSGEALVRNLQLGHRIANSLGRVMKAGYNIFSWGQVSQLPQLYRQFGMDAIIFYRGIDQSRLKRLEFNWVGADGVPALGITFGALHRLNFWRFVYLPYIFGGENTENWQAIGCETLGDSYLMQLCGEDIQDINPWVGDQRFACDLEAAKAGLQELKATVAGKAATDELLFLQGFDQENPDPAVTRLIDLLNREESDGKLRIASLEHYIARVKEKLPAREELETRSGEMLEVERVGDAFGPLYTGVFSARMPVKLANAQSEYDLICKAEPAAACAMLVGAEYPENMLDAAWKLLLQNQQHDGIGGCHVDRVTLSMLERYRQVRDAAGAIVKNSLRKIVAGIDLREIGSKEIGAVLFNTLSFCRDEIVRIPFDVPADWGCRWNGKGRREMGLAIADLQGNPVEAQVLWEEDDTNYAYLKYGNVFSYDMTRVMAAVRADSLPAHGYACLKANPRRNADDRRAGMWQADQVLENEFVRAEILANGSIELRDKRTGHVFRKLHYFEDSADRGGPLNCLSTAEQYRITTLTEHPRVALIYSGPLLTEYEIAYDWKVPARLETELKVHVPHGSEWIDQGRPRPGSTDATVGIRTRVTLKKGSRQLEFRTTVNNAARDHRLRVVMPANLPEAEICRVDSPFDVVRREIKAPDSSGWYEEAARTLPSHSFVCVEGEKLCAVVQHRGIPEYEVMDREDRAIALTLLRCFSNAGNPTELHQYQELAECQGSYEFHYSFGARDRDVSDADLYRSALAFCVPVYPVQTTKHAGELAARRSFLAVDHPDFCVTALKRDEGDPERLLLRGVNLSERTIEIGLEAPGGICDLRKIDLEGNVMEELDAGKRIPVSRREIATFSFRMAART